MKRKISANGRLENREDQGMSLHIQNFQSKEPQEEKMMWRAHVLRGNKNAQFLSPPEF
jgi:hypothetical protein